MFRRLSCLAALGLLMGLVGCVEDQKVVQRLPAPAPAGPEKRVEPPKPKPPPLTAERPPAGLPWLTGKVVVVDAGHGGKDPGTRGVSRLQEKTIVLLIANEVSRLLQARRATVVPTRTTDRFLELDQRAAIAQQRRASLFVSVHADAAARASASGSTVYIGRQASSQSLAAAMSIVRALNQAGISCRGVQRANYRVLVAHSRPAVLVECGYLTNSSDAYRLNQQAYRSKVAQAIAKGIADYLAR